MTMIMSLEGQLEAQREAQLTVHVDQESLVNKLTQVKNKMIDIRVVFGEYE